MIGFMYELHANVAEVDRPAARMDFSDEQWARVKAAFATLAPPSHHAPSETLVSKCIKETGCEHPVACNATRRCALERLTAPSEAGAERQEEVRCNYCDKVVTQPCKVGCILKPEDFFAQPAKGDAGVVEGWNRTTDGTIGQP